MYRSLRNLREYRQSYSYKELIFAMTIMASISVYEQEFGFFVLLCSFVLLGYLFIKTIIRSNNIATYKTYYLFIGIYGLLAILSHIQLIEGRDPNEYYYIHYDAAGSFYAKAVLYLRDLSWEKILNFSLLSNLYLADYPLAAIIFGIVAKIGDLFQIADSRLLLRCHVFVFAAIVAALITDIQIARGIGHNKSRKRAVVFGLISYLFVTSCIFSRDLHVCFAFTLLGYIVLLPNCRYRLLKMIIVALIAMGFRPVSGVLTFIFILGYYYSKKSSIKYLFIPLLIILIFLFFRSSEFMDDGLRRLNKYEEMAEAQQGGVFGMVYSLPFPINQIGMIVYMLLMPLPVTKFLLVENGGTYLTLPFLLSPYLISLVFLGSFWLLTHQKGKDKVVLHFMLLALLVFAVTVMGSPDLRRSFASIPGVFMAFCLYWDDIPKHLISKWKKIIWPLITIINIVFLIYLYL